MSKSEAQEFKRRWTLVNEAEVEELRRTPLAVKVRQLAVMMASARRFGWNAALEAEEQQVRERWVRLRERLRT